jgi:hypothetical protein
MLMDKSSEAETLGRALEILYRGILDTSTWMEPASKDDVLSHFLARNEEDIRKKRVGRLKTGMKEMLRDLPHSVPLPVQRRLFAQVEQETGLRLATYLDRDSARLKAILARGRIRNEDEYRLLRSHIDTLEGDPGQAAALQEAYRLSGEFETRLLTARPR